MINCCGKGRATNFCPTCGKELNSSPLVSLLTHCQTRRDNIVKQAAAWRGVEDSRHKARATKLETTAEKWERWCKALLVVIAGGQ